MATLAWISPPTSMRVDAAFAGDETAAPLTVVHVGQSAVVLSDRASLESSHTLVTITPEKSGLMPGGFCLALEDYLHVREALWTCESAGTDVVLAGWNGDSATIEPTDLRLSATHVSPESALRMSRVLQGLLVADEAGSVMSPEPLRRNAPDLARQALGGSVPSTALRAMVGAGPGTTPSGDDVIGGVLAGLRILGLGDQAQALGHAVTPHLRQTTAASRHYLSSAIDGRFGEHVHHLIAALAAAEAPELTLRRASLWGATSGVDLLFGLVATLVTPLNSRSMGSAA